MATLDLKPLTKETIDKMGFNNHDLWMVKIEEEVYGPFEGQSLKHYASENEDIFDAAFASRVENNDFRPFWSHALFQRRNPQVLSAINNHEGPFWILVSGQKQGPYSYHDIDKKIEMDLLSMTDHISVDDGISWKKIFEISGLDRRKHSTEELPEAPFEASFQKAKLALIEKMERPHHRPEEELAELAHLGQNQAKVLTLKLDEMNLNNLHHQQVSESLKWAVPSAMLFIFTVVISGHYILSPQTPPEVVTYEEEIKTKGSHRPSTPNPSLNIPKAQIPSARAPASVGPTSAPQPVTNYNDSRYPTHMETHEDAHYSAGVDDREGLDSLDSPVYESEANAPQEHSLVNNSSPEDQSLDATMSGTDQPLEPVVEEVSDF